MKPKIKNINLQIEFILSSTIMLLKYIKIIDVSMWIVFLPIILKLILGIIAIIINVVHLRTNSQK